MIGRGALFAAMLLLANPALAQQRRAADFFRGRTLTVIIPTTPGGGRAANAEPLLDAIGRHIPGNPRVVAQFMPGAGGAVGLNYLYHVAPHDGSVIATPLAAFIIAQVTGDKSAQYDASKMNWIGRTTDSTQVLYVWRTSAVKSVLDAKSKQVLIGSDGVSSASTIIPLVMNAAFGTRFRVIQGYEGSAAFNLAVQRGETDGALTTWNNLENSHRDWLKGRLVRLLFQVSSAPNPEIRDVPLALDLAKSEADRSLIELMDSPADLGESFVAPPGVPPAIVEELRRAFDATMTDPAYLEVAKKLGIVLNPLTGEQLTAITQRTLETPRAVIARYQAAVSKQ